MDTNDYGGAAYNSTRTGTADDDAANAGAGTTAAPTSTSGQSNTSSTQNTGQKSTNSAGSDFSNNRTDNPLNNFSSYTYSISLYVITPEDANKYTETGQLPSDKSKYYVVAQSGGISAADSRAITSSGTPGPNQMGLDYFIDSLEFKTIIPNSQTSSMVQGHAIKLKIVEPYGFNFTDQLKKTISDVSKNSTSMKNSIAETNYRSQRFILGIRYYGYDTQGNLVTANSGFVKKYSNGFSDVNSVLEKYVIVTIDDLKFKINGDSTVYNMLLKESSSSFSGGTIINYIQSPLDINGTTVGEVLSGKKGTTSKSLISELNKQNQKLVDNKNITTQHTFELEFLDEKNNPDPYGPIASAKISGDVNSSKRTSNMALVSSTSQSNVGAQFKQQTINNNIKTVSFNYGTKISQIIDDIISKSSYVSDALKVLNSEDPESSSTSNSAPKSLKWFSINPVVTTKLMDPKTNYWAFNIKYQIKPYNIYYIKSNNVTTFCKFNGAHKVYNYFLTGENTQVLNYELQYNYLYFIPENFTATSTTGLANTTNKPADKKTAIVSAPQGGSQSGTGGVAINSGSIPEENVRAQLYSPQDNVSITMKIMGDPDWIITNTGININGTSNLKLSAAATSSSSAAVRGDKLDILSGQLLVQVIFNTANDYKNDGLMDVSDQVANLAPGARNFNIKGTIYTVSEVTSVFSKGSFTQTLIMQIVESNLLVTENSNSSTDGRESTKTDTVAGDFLGNVSSNRPTLANPANSQGDIRKFENEQIAASQKQTDYAAMSNPYSGLSAQTTLTANDDTVRPKDRDVIGELIQNFTNPRYINPQTELKLPSLTINPNRR